MKPQKSLNNELTKPIKRKKFSPELDPYNNLVTKVAVKKVAEIFKLKPRQVMVNSSFSCSHARSHVYYILFKHGFSYGAIAKLMDQRSNIQWLHTSVRKLIQKYEIDETKDSIYPKIEQIIELLQSSSSEELEAVISGQSSVVS